MTDYDKIEAGRLLDSLVAERVMGWTPQPDDWEIVGHFKVNHETQTETFERASVITSCPPYSTSWAAAGEVVEKLRERYPVTIEVDKNGYHCEIWSDFVHSSHYRQIAEATAETFQLAVSRIALKVADSSVREGEG